MNFLFFYLGLLFILPVQDKTHTNNKNGVGIQGYDPVSYFKDRNPREGDSDIVAVFDDVKYFFISEENKHTFESDPARYLPEYGGWCAYAIGKSGDKVKVDPNTFKIVDGKLYLFYNFKGYNTLSEWNKDESNLLLKARENWARIVTNQY